MTLLQVFLFFSLIWAALLIYLAAVTIESGFIGLVFRFGKFRRVLKPGLNVIIPFLDKVEIHSTQTRQIELPAEPEMIDRENDLLAPGMKHPFRVGHKSMEEAVFYVKTKLDLLDTDPKAYEKVRFTDLEPAELQEAMKKDPYHFAVTGEHSVVVEWHLKGEDRKSIEDFIQNVSPEDGRDREQEVMKRLEDEVASVLQDFVPVTFGHMTERLVLFSAMLRDRLEILVGEKPDPSGSESKPWGIHIGKAFIKQPHAGKTVNKARNASAAATADRETKIRDAEANKQTAMLEAEGAAFAEEQKGKGEAARIKAMAEAMKSPEAQFLAQLDVAETVLPKANFIVVPSDVGPFAGILALGQSLAQKNKPGNSGPTT